MYSIWLLLFIVLSLNIITAIDLRCTEDINGSLQLIENCRACVIFIDVINLPLTNTTISPRKILPLRDELSIEELFLLEKRTRRNSNTIIRQKCAHEYDGPLYGYDQTHCYCNTNQCNSNIQRCIYEVTSKRHFSCYYGSNSSHHSMEIHHKCRSCRIRIGSDSTYHYECLTFGEREQKNQTHCTCQHPMCNQDLITCQRFQEKPSQQQPRTNLIREVSINSTTTTITSSSITPMKILLTLNATEEENSTFINLTSTLFNEIKPDKTIPMEINNQANYFSLNFYFLYVITSLVF